MIGISNDYMVEDFDLQELAGSDEVASHTDVRVGRLRLPAGMVMHG